MKAAVWRLVVLFPFIVPLRNTTTASGSSLLRARCVSAQASCVTSKPCDPLPASRFVNHTQHKSVIWADGNGSIGTRHLVPPTYEGKNSYMAESDVGFSLDNVRGIGEVLQYIHWSGWLFFKTKLSSRSSKELRCSDEELSPLNLWIRCVPNIVVLFVMVFGGCQGLGIVDRS